MRWKAPRALIAITWRTSSQVKMWYSLSGVPIMARSLGLRFWRKSGQSLSRSLGGMLTCQYGSVAGSVAFKLPIVEEFL